MLERPLALARDRRRLLLVDEVPLRELVDARVELVAGSRQRGERPRPEDHPADGRVLGDALDRAAEGVEPGADQRLERRRDRSASLGERASELLQEERVAVGPQQELGRCVAAQYAAEQLLARLRRERGEVDAQVGGDRRQVGPRGAEEEHGRSGAFDDEPDQLEQRRLGPVQVLEDEEQRALLRRELEQAPESPVDLRLRELVGHVRAARRRMGAEQDRHRCGHRAELVEVPGGQPLEERAELA